MQRRMRTMMRTTQSSPVMIYSSVDARLVQGFEALISLGSSVRMCYQKRCEGREERRGLGLKQSLTKNVLAVCRLRAWPHPSWQNGWC